MRPPDDIGRYEHPRPMTDCGHHPVCLPGLAHRVKDILRLTKLVGSPPPGYDKRVELVPLQIRGRPIDFQLQPLPSLIDLRAPVTDNGDLGPLFSKSDDRVQAFGCVKLLLQEYGYSFACHLHLLLPICSSLPSKCP